MTRAQIERAGMFAAAQASKKYNVRSDRWVDVFAAVRAANALMMFQPLRHMSGAFLDGEDVERGVLVNSNHPLSRQRMTAAHELGHLVLGHKSVVDIAADDEFQLATKSQTDDERLAESFARWFLMPHALIDSAMQAMGQEKLSTPSDVYRLSLYLGTSYQSTATHVVAAQRATKGHSEVWLKQAPAKVKAALSEGLQLDDAWSDVHVLQYFETGTARIARQGDLFILHLPERPTTGFRWVLSAQSERWFKPLRDDYDKVPADDELSGGTSVRRFALQVRTIDEPIPERLTLHNVRSWEPDRPVQTFTVEVHLETPKRLGIPFPEEYLVAA